MPPKSESFHNLLDKMVLLIEDPSLHSNTSEMFRKLLVDYFFKKETYDSKKFEFFLSEFESPAFIENVDSIFEIDIEELRNFVEGEMVNNSLAGRIMLSTPYLRSFYPNSASDFNSLPEDVQFELVGKIKDMNSRIITAFQKMLNDIEADKNRKIITLIALILKNVFHKTGRPLNKLSKPANEIIKSIFRDVDDLFVAKPQQVSDLSDDTKVKELVKAFFTIKQFKDITEISEAFKDELERYKKRSILSSSR